MFSSDRTTSSISQIARLLLDPTHTVNVAKAHLLLGLEAESRSDWEDAAENYLRIVELAPADHMVLYFGHNNRAGSLLRLSRFDEASAHCMAAIEVDASRHQAYDNLGLAFEALGRLAEAAVCFIGAAYRNAADKQAWLHLQQLVSGNPELLVESADLGEQMEVLRKFRESRGHGIPNASDPGTRDAQ
jgi:tetratricopeptide (TPR) repeat protein